MAIVPKTGTITLQDSQISLVERGSGDKTVLLLHGNPGRKSDFDAVADLLAEAGFRCLVPDRPGHGNSEELIPEEPDPWLDANLYAELIEKKCQGRAYVVGYSLGAFLALKLIGKHPQRVRGLGLVAPYIQPPDPLERPSSIPTLAKNAVFGTFLGMVLPSLANGKIRAHLARVWEPKEIPAEVLEKEMGWYTRFESLVATIHDKNDMLGLLGEVHASIAGVTCPVLLISGKQDQVCDPQAQLERVTVALPQARTVLVEDGGHGLLATHPELVAHSLRGHIEDCLKQ